MTSKTGQMSTHLFVRPWVSTLGRRRWNLAYIVGEQTSRKHIPVLCGATRNFAKSG